MSIIKLINVNKIYKIGKVKIHVLKDINLEINNGEYIAIVGASGSGKTTLMNVIGCLDKISSGKYLFDGEDISSLSDRNLSYIRNKKIGFIFQSFNLIKNYNVLENVLLPTIYSKNKVNKKEVKEKALFLIEQVGLKDRIKHKPDELSGGQQQRVAIARALINNPEIILADEPTGNLDSKSTSEIINIFNELNSKGTTIVMVTHELDIAKNLKKRVFLKDGFIERID